MKLQIIVVDKKALKDSLSNREIAFLVSLGVSTVRMHK